MTAIPAHVDPSLVVPYDLIDGEEVRRFPPAALEHVREKHRVFYSPLHGGFWVFTRYADIHALCLDTDRLGQWVHGIPPAPHLRPLVPNSLDPPEHTPWRQALLPLFSTAKALEMEQSLREAARDQLAELLLNDRCDLLKDYAFVVPAARFCLQLGLPAQEFTTFRSLSDDLQYGAAKIALEEGPSAAAAHVQAVGKRINDIIAAVLQERRSKRQDDVVSALIDVRINGRPLSDEEILDVTSLLFFAGTESTAAQIAFATLHLAAKPTQLARLVAHPEELPAAVEEMLRLHATHQMVRVARTDFEYAGAHLKKGDLIVLPLGTANRDPAIFDQPSNALLDRSPNRQLAFGHGVHRCIGIHFARREMVIALDELHRAIPAYVIDESVPLTFACMGGKARPDKVPVRYTARMALR